MLLLSAVCGLLREAGVTAGRKACEVLSEDEHLCGRSLRFEVELGKTLLEEVTCQPNVREERAFRTHTCSPRDK